MRISKASAARFIFQLQIPFGSNKSAILIPSNTLLGFVRVFNSHGTFVHLVDDLVLN